MSSIRLSRATLGAAVVAAFLPFGMKAGVVSAAPPANTNNVTICHRTHSTTNPYVRITVDQRSVGNANSKHGGGSHDVWATTVYQTKPSPNVYNPAKTYPANDKKWGDIIAFTDVSGNALQGTAANVAGLNNTGIGADIFNGTGAYAGLCRQMNARDYYEVEKAAGVPPADILADMNELDSPDFATELAACNGTFTGCDVNKLGTPVLTAATTTTVAGGSTGGATTATTIAAGATQSALPSGVTLAAGKGALKVKTWIDANRNGKKASSEKYLKNITVKISGPNGTTKTAKTNSNGEALFLDLDPGEWSVVSTLSIDGYEKVYDSDGTVNWKSKEAVVEGQVAAASFAAATTAGTSSNSLPATGNSSALMTVIAGVFLAMGLIVTGSRKRRIS